MTKTFVLDTNVILYDPLSIFKFSKHTVLIPIICVEELDKFKRDQNENGRNARYFARIVDGLRKKGALSEGVELSTGGKLVIGQDLGSKDILNLDMTKNDNQILAATLHFKSEGKQVILVTKDINLRLKADVLGINSEDYGAKDLKLEELYTGQTQIEITPEKMEEFKTNRFLPIKGPYNLGLNPNEYVILYEQNNHNHRLLGRYYSRKGGVVPIINMKDGIWGIHPKNLEQQFAFDCLMNKEIKLVSLVGKAGTGKTLLAIAAGLECVLSKEEFDRVLVARPIQPMGRDIGYLPGTISDKLGPWMRPMYDTLEFLFGKSKGGRNSKNENSSWLDLIEQKVLIVEPLTYMRGRSIASQFLIIDEAQNLSPHEIKTIVTRASEGSKIILTGDCEQVDNPYLDSVNNGLAYSVERLKTEQITSHITLKVGERSELSEIASKLL